MKGQMMTLIKLIKSRHKYQEEERGQRSEKKKKKKNNNDNDTVSCQSLISSIDID